ncbi:hypothetical protein ABIA07_006580 [Bradyrhizobium yuanmingense]
MLGKAIVAATDAMLTTAPPLPARSTRPHRAEGVLHAEHGADDVDVAHPPGILGPDLADQRRDLDAGIVDEDVVAAEGGDRRSSRFLPLHIVGDIEMHEAGLHSEPGDLAGAILADVIENVADHDRRTGARQCFCNSRSYPAGSAGDQGFAAIKTLLTHRTSSLCLD